VVNGTAILADPLPIVRIADENDEEALWQILKGFHAEQGIGPLSEPIVRQAIQHGTRKQGGVIGIVDGEGEIAATIGIEFSNWWYSDRNDPAASLLREFWIYVRPQYRHSGCADALVDFAKEYADALSRELGMSVPLVLAVLGNERVEAKVRLFRRKFPLAGAAFLHRPKV
jgi:GNAT superfamily N-acetyltransferase